MHLRHQDLYATKQFHTQATRNPFLIIPLTIFTVVSAMPANALAFETKVSESREAVLLASVNIDRPNEARSSVAISSFTSPITLTGAVQESAAKLAIALQAPVLPISPAATPTPIPVPAPAPVPAPVAITAGSVLTLEGEASYYSRAGCLGCDPAMIMANGQPLNDGALTMAIGANLKQYVGYHARVTSLATGKSVVVKITDTGGSYKAKYGNRVADLTIAAKTAIGMAGGVGQVRVDVLGG